MSRTSNPGCPLRFEWSPGLSGVDGMTAKWERPRRPSMSARTARNSPGVLASTAFGRRSAPTRSHFATSNAGSKWPSLTIFQTASNVSPALYVSVEAGRDPNRTPRSNADAATRRDFIWTSLDEGLDGRRRLERRCLDFVVLDRRERDLLLDAHDLLGDSHRLHELAELLVVTLDARHGQRPHRRLARVDAARAKAGCDVVEVEVVDAVEALQADLVAGAPLEGGLLDRFHDRILPRIAQLAVEVRVVFRLRQFLADFQHGTRHRRHRPGVRAVETLRDVANAGEGRLHEHPVRVRGAEDLHGPADAGCRDRQRPGRVHRLVPEDRLAAAEGLDVPVDDLARVRQLGCRLRLRGRGRLRVKGRHQQRRHCSDSKEHAGAPETGGRLLQVISNPGPGGPGHPRAPRLVL